MKSITEFLDEHRARTAALERNRLDYAWLLGWLVRAVRMPEEWQADHRTEMLEVASVCRDARAAATGKSIAEADRLWGTVLDSARSIVAGEGMELHTAEDVAAMLGARIV